MYHLRQLKDTKGVIRGRNSKKDENTMAKRKRKKQQTIMDNILHREQKIEQR